MAVPASFCSGADLAARPPANDKKIFFIGGVAPTFFFFFLSLLCNSFLCLCHCSHQAREFQSGWENKIIVE